MYAIRIYRALANRECCTGTIVCRLHLLLSKFCDGARTVRCAENAFVRPKYFPYLTAFYYAELLYSWLVDTRQCLFWFSIRYMLPVPMFVHTKAVVARWRTLRASIRTSTSVTHSMYIRSVLYRTEYHTQSKPEWRSERLIAISFPLKKRQIRRIFLLDELV